MKCPAPPLVYSLKNIIRSKRAEQMERKVQPVKIVQLGFIMDGVLALRNLSGIPALDHTLKYFPNPKVYNLTESNTVKVVKGDDLIIEVCKKKKKKRQNKQKNSSLQKLLFLDWFTSSL